MTRALRSLCLHFGAAPLVILPCQYIPADANGGLCIGRSCVDALGALRAFGHQQAAPGIYRCIACYYYQGLKMKVECPLR